MSQCQYNTIQQRLDQELLSIFTNWLACKSKAERARFDAMSIYEKQMDFENSAEFKFFKDKVARESMCNFTQNKSERTIVLNLFFRLRRGIRKKITECDGYHHILRNARREAAKLKEQNNRFNTTRIAETEETIDCFDFMTRRCTDEIKEWAQSVIEIAPIIDVHTTLEERCDLLNINIADRHKIDTSENTGIVHLIAVYGLEDSAYHRGEDGKNGAMANAINDVMIDFLCNTPEGKKIGNTLFEPGGLLQDIPMYKMQPDGVLKRMPPRLHLVPTGKDEVPIQS